MTKNKIKNSALFSFIWKFVRTQRWIFSFIFLLSLVWSFDATLAPYLMRRIIDTLTLHDADRAAAWPMLQSLLLCFVFLWAIVEAGFRSRGFLNARTYPKLEADIRMAMFD